MYIKCHDQNSGHKRNHNKISWLRYADIKKNIMIRRSGHALVFELDGLKQ